MTSLQIETKKILPMNKPRLLLTMLLLLPALLARSQHISHTFRNVSLADALVTVDKMSDDWQVSFIYDDLEDYRVSCTVSDKSVPEAVHALIGYYPMRIEIAEGRIFVECTQRWPYKFMGRLVDANGQPVTYANIVLYSTADSTRIASGVSNQDGHFTIPCMQQQARVRISHVGFATWHRLMEMKNVGTLRLQTATEHLQTVDVALQQDELPAYENNYKRYADAVRRRVWSMSLPSFRLTAAPEALADSGTVVLAKYTEFNILSQDGSWPFAAMFGLVGAVGSAVANNSRQHCSELCRVRVLLNSEEAAARWATLAGYQPRMHLWEAGRSVVGIRIRKPDGSQHEVDVDEVVSAILQKKKWQQPGNAIKIKGLQAGDILDVFFFNEEMADIGKSGTYAADFADAEPTLDLIFRMTLVPAYHTDLDTRYKLMTQRGFDSHGNHLYTLHANHDDCQGDASLQSLNVAYWRGKQGNKKKKKQYARKNE